MGSPICPRAPFNPIPHQARAPLFQHRWFLHGVAALGVNLHLNYFRQVPSSSARALLLQSTPHNPLRRRLHPQSLAKPATPSSPGRTKLCPCPLPTPRPPPCRHKLAAVVTQVATPSALTARPIAIPVGFHRCFHAGDPSSSSSVAPAVAAIHGVVSSPRRPSLPRAQALPRTNLPSITITGYTPLPSHPEPLLASSAHHAAIPDVNPQPSNPHNPCPNPRAATHLTVGDPRNPDAISRADLCHNHSTTAGPSITPPP
ncbi:hypothetical protein M0R45_030809 [Rubus argutus]|uniref:SWIM-type domain-containing protein n=1 Tax=Rubus argutus TaxID=59490 RepID=A0AAW1WEL2_RUBAR